MSSRIDIPLRPSVPVGCLAALPWLTLCVFILILAREHGALFLVLLPVALAGAGYQWKLNGRLSLNHSIISLTVTERGLQAQQRNGAQYPAIAGSQSRLYPGLVILKLNPEDATHRPSTVLLWAQKQQSGDGSGTLPVNGPGNVPGDLHRQLRAWLRLGSTGERPGQSH